MKTTTKKLYRCLLSMASIIACLCLFNSCGEGGLGGPSHFPNNVKILREFAEHQKEVFKSVKEEGYNALAKGMAYGEETKAKIIMDGKKDIGEEVPAEIGDGIGMKIIGKAVVDTIKASDEAVLVIKIPIEITKYDKNKMYVVVPVDKDGVAFDRRYSHLENEKGEKGYALQQNIKNGDKLFLTFDAEITYYNVEQMAELKTFRVIDYEDPAAKQAYEKGRELRDIFKAQP